VCLEEWRAGKLHVDMEWDTGTGQPSQFLSIENVLEGPECTEYGALEKK
jgi:hypothetical protein